MDLSMKRSVPTRAPRILVYGPAGVGKTTFAASFPSPVIVQTERGASGELTTPSGEILSPVWIPGSGPCESLEHLQAAISKVATKGDRFETVVLDSADWAERLIHRNLIESHGKPMATLAGGYGAGYELAVKIWSEILGSLDAICDQGKTIILIAHASSVRFESPDHPAFDRWAPRLHKKSCDLITEWADCVGVATQKWLTRQVDNDRRSIGVGTSEDERVLRCRPHAAAIAKCRWPVPEELALTFESFAEHCTHFAKNNDPQEATS